MRREQEPPQDNQNEFRRQERFSALEKAMGGAILLGASFIDYLPVNLPLAAGGVALIAHSLVGDRRRRQ